MKKRIPQDAQFSGKTNRRVGLSFLYVWIDSRGGHRESKEIPLSADSGSGRCPENLRPFEKGRRKLYFACGRELVRCYSQKENRDPIKDRIAVIKKRNVKESEFICAAGSAGAQQPHGCAPDRQTRSDGRNPCRLRRSPRPAYPRHALPRADSRRRSRNPCRSGT